jgi:hypothetical protein
LQHLSNAQISAVLQHCRQFANVIVTEHMVSATPAYQPNVDINHGVETRVDLGSCVRLDAPPFGWTVKKKLCEVPLPDGSFIQTLWVEPPADRSASDAT